MVVCLAVMAIYLAPYFYFGTGATLQIFDNLDSNYSWYKILLDSGALWANNSHKLDQIFNGVPRICLPSQFDAHVLMFGVLGPYGAYVLNRFMMTFIGFIGMHCLLKRHVIPGEQKTAIQYGVALCFGILPFWPFGGLSVAGIPLVVNIFLNIRSKNSAWYDWVILFLYPVYSSLILSGAFLLFSLMLLWLWDLVRKKASWTFLLALLLISFAYVFTHYRLFLGFLLEEGFVSHRVEFAGGTAGLRGALWDGAVVFLRGQGHAPSLHTWLVLPAVVLAAFFFKRRADDRSWKIFVTGIGFVLLTSLFYGVVRWQVLGGFNGAVMKHVPVQLDRFYVLHPAIWMILFAVSLSVLVRKARWGAPLTSALMLAQTLYAGSKHELLVNREGPSVAGFYATEQFKAIADFIGADKAAYRVVSLGLHPVIAQYNGFYTLDGYLPNYPLSYKHQFRRIIARELEKSRRLREDYDNWGSRVYLFSSELREEGGYVTNFAGNRFQVQQLDIDKGAFRAMGGRYILSAVRVNETRNPGIVFRWAFRDARSAWDIYLYEVE